MITHRPAPTSLAVALAVTSLSMLLNISASAAPFAPIPELTLQAKGEADEELTLPAPDGTWDLSASAAIVMTVKNASDHPATVRARVEAASASGVTDSCRSAIVLMPAESGELRVRLMRRPQDPGYEPFKPFYMYFKSLNVRNNTIDPAAVARLVIAIDEPKKGQKVVVTDVRPDGQGSADAPPFVPFIDQFGQYLHSDWPGKVDSVDDFAARRKQEEQERRAWSGPADWNQYGGWEKGPTLKATGFFYATKHEGKWWLVDPTGKLYWSYGPTGVGFGGDLTPITDREKWFVSLPDRSKWADAYRTRRGATYMYYKDREWEGFDVASINLHHKYGADYRKVVAELSHERLRSWGFNSIGNWSASEVYALRRTPYTVPIHYEGNLIHYRMPDIYHPDWEKSVRARMERERGRTNEDPWNVGYFVDNERWWSPRARGAGIAEETLKNDAQCHAKIKLVELLQQKYPTIAALNEAWGTAHESWQALLDHKQPPNMRNPKVLADCGDFGMMWAERYFSTVRDSVKSVAPNIMYLGCRFHGHIDAELVKVASKYADVISYNVYDNPPDGRLNQYRRLDVPILSSEWGIESDPLLTPFRGDKSENDPKVRVGKMTGYAERAIRHPLVVGAHFFQYRDQPISGRPDGEAVLRGFVNITDTPNFELVQANRRIGYELYKMRVEAR
jgi:Beta-galactosidase